MTAEELRVMDEEDNGLRELLKGHWYEADQKIPVYDQPVFYSSKWEDEEEEEHQPLENYWKPCGINWAKKLRESAGGAILPAVLAFTTWTFRMSGDMSRSLSTPLIITCLIITAVASIKPWLED